MLTKNSAKKKPILKGIIKKNTIKKVIKSVPKTVKGREVKKANRKTVAPNSKIIISKTKPKVITNKLTLKKPALRKPATKKTAKNKEKKIL